MFRALFAIDSDCEKFRWRKSALNILEGKKCVWTMGKSRRSSNQKPLPAHWDVRDLPMMDGIGLDWIGLEEIKIKKKTWRLLTTWNLEAFNASKSITLVWLVPRQTHTHTKTQHNTHTANVFWNLPKEVIDFE